MSLPWWVMVLDVLALAPLFRMYWNTHKDQFRGR